MFDHCKYTEQYDPHIYTYHIPCIFCGKVVDVPLPADGLFAYRRGALVQVAFPLLGAGLREMLITNICPECWNTTFPPEDDGDDLGCTCNGRTPACTHCHKQSKQAEESDQDLPF